MRERYRGAVTLRRAADSGFACAAIIVASGLLLRVAGEDFFPTVDAGMMRLHVRMPTGTRIEHTEYGVDRIDRAIRQVIPASQLQGISDNIGLPISYDLAFYQTDSTGPQDADILIQLKPNHQPTAMYEERIRRMVARDFPQVTAYFQAADIVSQVLTFGLPAAIDVQISGNDLDRTSKSRPLCASGCAISRVGGSTHRRAARLSDFQS